MSSLIKKAFSRAKKGNRPALLTYTVAGDNTKKKVFRNPKFYIKLCRYL
jgi:tryptophan synthase alpha subunit